MVGVVHYRRSPPTTPLVEVTMRRFLVSLLLCCISLATVPNCAYGVSQAPPPPAHSPPPAPTPAHSPAPSPTPGHSPAPSPTPGHSPAPAPTAVQGAEIAVPSYVFPCSGTPGCAWDEYKSGASIVVLNPNSGPGTSNDSFYEAYKTFLTTIKQGTTIKTVLGYVSTSFGNRAASLVLSDIDTYYQIYSPIDGIFLDEGSTNCDETTLYESYDAEVKSKGGLAFTALNWGTVGPECFLTETSINTYVTFEGPFAGGPAAYSSLNDSQIYPDWMRKYPDSYWWQLVYAIPDVQSTVQAAVNRAINTLHAGYIYFTDGPASNPYNVSASPSVWAVETMATSS